MSFESVRAAVATVVSSEWALAQPSVPMEMENHNQIDLNARRDPFVTYELRYVSSRQSSLENVPQTRYQGEALFHVAVPSGRGTKTGFTLADSLVPILKYRRVSGVQFQAPRLMPAIETDGWYIWPLAFSFHYTE